MKIALGQICRGLGPRGGRGRPPPYQIFPLSTLAQHRWKQLGHDRGVFRSPVMSIGRPLPGPAYDFLPSLSNCFRNAITLSRSCSDGSPGKIIFVPGTFARGLVKYSFRVASSQVMPEPLFASE